MKILLPYILSILVPGAGQLYLRKYSAGLLFLLTTLTCIVLFPSVPASYPYIIMTVLSVTDIHYRTQKIAGRRKALANTFFAIIIVVVVVPFVFFLFFTSMYKGGQYIKNEYLDIENTENEMVEIAKALNKYNGRNNEYPADFDQFVLSKPIWRPWATDSWDNKYRYELTGQGFILTSAGTDGIFDTDDDLKRTN